MSKRENSDYDSRRAQYRRMITVYGRKAVLEALADESLHCETLHLARTNRRGGIVADLIASAAARGIAVNELARDELSRISRNGRQDQGVALDVRCERMRELADHLRCGATPQRLLALDGVTNPQNAGMAIRSAVAAGIDGILYADRGNPALGPLVIKASSGTVFQAPLLRCDTIANGVRQCLSNNFALYRLQAAKGGRSLFSGGFSERALFVLGGETSGITDAVQDLPGENVAIPMTAGVESLNVAVSAALVCYAAAHLDK